MSHNSYVTVIHPKGVAYDPGCADTFIVGPIRNAPSWHEDIIDIMVRMVRTDTEDIRLRINCPKRKEDMVRLSAADPPPERVFARPRQRAWEFDTQETSAHSAGILMWLGAPGQIEFPEKVYGAMTQVEFGYWSARARADPRLRIAIGTDGVYNGELFTLEYDIERLAPWLLPFHTSLESLAAQAIRWAKLPLA